MSIFYPLLCKPIIKERIWGGTKLTQLFSKETTIATAGESWELSTVEGDISVIANGVFKGKTIEEVLQEFPNEILGKKVVEKYGQTFPLLFKFIDAKDDLSIQVHPDDELAKVRHQSFGKTEMWYIMQAEEDAHIILGFKEGYTREDYLHHLEKETLPQIMKQVPVKKGDVFLLESGLIHAIGKGIVLAEIQQTSDVTYRVYDYNRIDAQGNKRQLHTDLAIDAIDFERKTPKINYDTIQNNLNQMVSCAYFKTSILFLEGKKDFQYTGDSFIVYMCTEGVFTIYYEAEKLFITVGQTVLLPACLTKFSFEGNATILEIVVP